MDPPWESVNADNATAAPTPPSGRRLLDDGYGDSGSGDYGYSGEPGMETDQSGSFAGKRQEARSKLEALFFYSILGMTAEVRQPRIAHLVTVRVFESRCVLVQPSASFAADLPFSGQYFAESLVLTSSRIIATSHHSNSKLSP